MNSSRVSPVEKENVLNKKKYRLQYNNLKKFFLLIKQRRIVYPLTGLLLALVLYGYGYCVSGKQKEFADFHPVLQTMEYVSNFLLTASIVITVLYLPQNSKNFYEFFTALYPEGNKLLVPLLAMKKNHFWRNFLLCNLCIVSLISFNAWFFLVNFGWQIYKFIIFRDLEFCVYNLLLLFLLALTRKLELRFAELNDILKYKTENFLKSNMARKRNVPPPDPTSLAFILNSEHFYSGQQYLFSFYGDQIQKEGEKTTKICFYLLNKVSITPSNDDERLVQEELKLLAFQSYSKIPCISAGGFFDVNFRVLGLMISSITSYLMVIIQFLLRPHN
ncbi:hypothetical protein GWI33_004478 [Rhynchophorus ferrugineus]|uniref:Gustatory receptor n=1 Tax=Rhynchophorus ferrugineus TaxID=354439 RepID=A0A834IKR6_RHYFE|nr:hypothetical protein GWI33_004478 [Rhynchophorus ferrugineus]